VAITKIQGCRVSGRESAGLAPIGAPEVTTAIHIELIVRIQDVTEPPGENSLDLGSRDVR
jgi:hypothetical protein